MLSSVSPLLNGYGTAGSYFDNISNGSAPTKEPTINKNMSPNQIRRQLQMQFASQTFGLTSNEQGQVNSYFSKLDNIYGVKNNSTREEQEKKLAGLNEQLNKLYGLSGEDKKLTDEEKKEIGNIQTQLDELYGLLPTKKPQGAELKRAESLELELRKLHYPENKVLTAAEKRKESSIHKELKELFGIEGPKELTEEEQATADELMKKMHKINGTEKKELNEEEQTKADQLIKEMESVVGNMVTHGLSKAEKNIYTNLNDKSDQLKALSKTRELTDSEQNELSKVRNNIARLLAKASSIQEQQDKQASQVHSQMSGFFSQLASYGGGSIFSAEI